jgi:hypothetical protein
MKNRKCHSDTWNKFSVNSSQNNVIPDSIPGQSKCKNTLFVKLSESFKSWVVFWIWFLFILLLWWTIYALVNNEWTAPNELEATSWSILTSEKWNAILSNQNALSWALNNLPWTHYSTDEIWTWNYWIDGKPIYRKVFILPNVNVSYNSGVNTSINVSELNIDTIINGNVLLNKYSNSKSGNWDLEIRVNSNILWIYNFSGSGNNIIGLNNFSNIGYIEYTKTTN